MKQRLVAAIIILALGAGIGTLVFQKQRSPRAQREKLVEQFIAILPDSLDNDHILEIRHLFYMLWEREDLGKVKPETSQEIADKLAGWVDKGRIGPKDLVYFMAEVGNSVYKDEKEYNLPDGSNDNPILNPKSSMISLKFDSTEYDSTFWSEFDEWKKDNPDLVDSLTQEYFTQPPRKR